MASIWRIDGVFSDMRIEKKGQVFRRVGLLVNLYSVPQPSLFLPLFLINVSLIQYK